MITINSKYEKIEVDVFLNENESNSIFNNLPSICYQDFSSTLRVVREKLKFNKKQMAEYLQLKYKTYLSYESNQSKIHPQIAYNLAIIEAWLDSKEKQEDKA